MGGNWHGGGSSARILKVEQPIAAPSAGSAREGKVGFWAWKSAGNVNNQVYPVRKGEPKGGREVEPRISCRVMNSYSRFIEGKNDIEQGQRKGRATIVSGV